MKYHFALDFSSHKMDINISYAGKKLYHFKAEDSKPKGFNSVGDESQGFDPDKFLLETSLNKFQYIDSEGTYDTVDIYDHNPAHKQNLSYLDDNAAFGTLMEEAVYEMFATGSHHMEFDWTA